MPLDANQIAISEILELTANTPTSIFHSELLKQIPEKMIEKIQAYVTKQSELTKPFFEAMNYLLTNVRRFNTQGDQRTPFLMMIFKCIFDKPSLINGPIIPKNIQLSTRDLTIAQLMEIRDPLAQEKANPALQDHNTRVPLQRLRVLHWMLYQDDSRLISDNILYPLVMNLKKILGLREALSLRSQYPHQPFSSEVIFQFMGLDPYDIRLAKAISRYTLLHADDAVIHLAIIEELEKQLSAPHWLKEKDPQTQVSVVEEAIALGKLTLCHMLFKSPKVGCREYFLLACATNQLTPNIVEQAKRSFYYTFQLVERFDTDGWEGFFLQGMEVTITCNANEAFKHLINNKAYIPPTSLKQSAQLIIQQKKFHFYSELLNLQEDYYWKELIQILLEQEESSAAFNLMRATLDGRHQDKQAFSLKQLYYFVSLLPASISNELFHHVVTYLMTRQTQHELAQTELNRCLYYTDKSWPNLDSLDCWIQLLEHAISSVDRRKTYSILSLLKGWMAEDVQIMIDERWESFSHFESYWYDLNDSYNYPGFAFANILLRNAVNAAQWTIVSTLLKNNLFKFSYSKTIGPVLHQAAQAKQFSIIVQFLHELASLIKAKNLKTKVNHYIKAQDKNEILFFAIIAEQWDAVSQLRDVLDDRNGENEFNFKGILVRVLRAIPLASEINWRLYHTLLSLKDGDHLNEHDIETEFKTAMSSARDDIITHLLTVPCLKKTFIEEAFQQAVKDKKWAIVLVFIQHKSTNQLSQSTIEWALDEVYRLVTGAYSSAMDVAAYTVYQTILKMTGNNAPSSEKLMQVKHDVKKRHDLMALLLSDLSPPCHHVSECGFFSTNAASSKDLTAYSSKLDCKTQL